MLYQTSHKEDKWQYTEYRYFCACCSPDHVLSFTIDDTSKTELEINIYSNPYMTLWQRIKQGIKLIFGQEVCYLGVVLHPEDREELGNAILGKIDEKS